ncbi:MAG: hypothetical protein EA353_14395 [Puniceicoccaceae bacterium]|nr:MAG: hypothetical protein EA353_14395 [Puniceicoccaceae bacterium]
MKLLFIIGLIAVGVFQLHTRGHFDSVLSQSRSLQGMENQLQEKSEKLLILRKMMAQAQANAPYCGGSKMRVTFPESTLTEVRQLEMDIAKLRVEIAEKRRDSSRGTNSKVSMPSSVY